MAVQSITIEPIRGRWWVCQHGTYDRTSILEGQEYRQLVRAYDSPDAAKADHPEAELLDHEWVPPRPYIPRNAPGWFDPLDAGEAWSEDDY